MAETDTPIANNVTPAITGSAPLYRRPEPLNPEQHGKLGITMQQNPFGFAAKQHFVPAVVSEFGALCTEYPIIFAGEERAPLAVLGLQDGENLFFFEDGGAREDVYIPAYIRRYPFTVAANETGEQMIVCIDRDSDLISEAGEVKFFENSQLSEYGKASVTFCENYERDRVITQDFVNKLKEFDLFESRDAMHTPRGPNGPGEPKVIANFFAVSEERLNALPPEKFLELRPALGPIYAHLISMVHWERLVNMAIARQIQAAEAAGGRAN